jgi:hypothetical protein
MSIYQEQPQQLKTSNLIYELSSLLDLVTEIESNIFYDQIATGALENPNAPKVDKIDTAISTTQELKDRLSIINRVLKKLSS